MSKVFEVGPNSLSREVFTVASASIGVVVIFGTEDVVSIASDPVVVDDEFTLTALLVRPGSVLGGVTTEVVDTSTVGGGVEVVVVHIVVPSGIDEVVSEGGGGGSVGSSPSVKQIHFQPLSDSLNIKLKNTW